MPVLQELLFNSSKVGLCCACHLRIAYRCMVYLFFRGLAMQPCMMGTAYRLPAWANLVHGVSCLMPVSQSLSAH